MSGTQSWALQKAIFEALNNNAALLALIGGAGIYDRVPEDAALPYITLGDGIWQDWSAGSHVGAEHFLRLHVWVRDGGRRVVREIADVVHTLLHDVPLAMEDGALVNIRFQQAQILTDPDGETWHGVLSYRAVTQAG